MVVCKLRFDLPGCSIRRPRSILLICSLFSWRISFKNIFHASVERGFHHRNLMQTWLQCLKGQSSGCWFTCDFDRATMLKTNATDRDYLKKTLLSFPYSHIFFNVN